MTMYTKPGGYETLPAIRSNGPGGSEGSGLKGIEDLLNSPEAGASSSALRKFNSKLSQNPAPFQDVSSGRVMQLEGRVDINEKANRALLEELVGLQGEIKARFRRADDSMQSEKQDRMQLQDNLKTNNQIVGKIVTRFEQLESNCNEDSKHLSQLLDHLKAFEKRSNEQNQHLLMSLNQEQVRVDHISQDVEGFETRFDKYKMQESKKFNILVEQVRILKQKLEAQSMETAELGSLLKQRVNKLEVEQRATIDMCKNLKESQTVLEALGSAFRAEVGEKVGEIDKDVVIMQRRQGQEESAREAFEKEAQRMYAELRSTIHEQELQYADTLSGVRAGLLDHKNREETQREKLEDRVRSVMEAQAKKHAERESKLRTEALSRFMSLEKSFGEEREMRAAFENEQRADAERRWKAIQAGIEEEIASVRNHQRMEKVGTSEAFAKLNESISLLEREISSTRHSTEKILRAEIKSRQREEQEINTKLGDTNTKIEKVAISIDKAIRKLDAAMVEGDEKVHQTLKKDISSAAEDNVRAIGDVNLRFNLLSEQMQKQEEVHNEEFKQLVQTQEASRKENMEAMTQWQNFTQTQLSEMEVKINVVPEQIAEQDNRFQLLKTEVYTRMDEEIHSRLKESQHVKMELGRKVGEEVFDRTSEDIISKIGGLDERVHEYSAKVSSVDRELHVTKTGLQSKISSEANQRAEAVMDLKRDLVRLQAQNEFLIKQHENERLFGKDKYGDTSANEDEKDDILAYAAVAKEARDNKAEDDDTETANAKDDVKPSEFAAPLDYLNSPQQRASDAPQEKEAEGQQEKAKSPSPAASAKSSAKASPEPDKVLDDFMSKSDEKLNSKSPKSSASSPKSLKSKTASKESLKSNASKKSKEGLEREPSPTKSSKSVKSDKSLDLDVE
eukprot:Nk52_evm20s249 gene=Nk52_evmTU20s249